MFHHLLDALSSLLVGDVDKIDAGRLSAEVDGCAVAGGLKGGHSLSEDVIQFDPFEVLARDGEDACGWVGGEYDGIINRLILRAPP